MTPLLELEQLRVSFGGVHALDGLSLAVQPGEVLALVGANGAGKTTVLNVVTRALALDSGRMRFDGRPLAPLRTHQLAALGIARTFQNLALVESASVLDNALLGRHQALPWAAAAALGWPAARARERQARQQVRALLAALGLSEVADAPAGDQPYGLRKLVELARALAAAPRLLLLDEPSSGLGPGETEALGACLLAQRARLGLTLVLVEHDRDLVAQIASRVLVLAQGRVAKEFRP